MLIIAEYKRLREMAVTALPPSYLAGNSRPLI